MPKYQIVGGKLVPILPQKQESEDLDPGRRPMQNAPAWPAFAPTKTKFHSDMVGPIDMRTVADWTVLGSWEVAQYQTAHVHVEAVSRDRPSNEWTEVAQGNLHVEVRVLGYLAGTPYTITEGVVSGKIDHPEERTAGPLQTILEKHEMPEKIEILVRGRRDGRAVNVLYSGAAHETEVLQVSARVKFRS